MKILSIGNSFSEDAQRYLKLIAGANGRELTCVNLYIGGCSLKRHYINLIDNEKSYHYQFGGENTGLMVSIKEVLGSNNWDFITLQQASHESTDIANFTPFLPEIADWLRLRCEGAKILLHQTWAYPEHTERLSQLGFKTTDEMFEKVKSAYDSAEKLIKPDGIIKSGEAMLKAYNLIARGPIATRFMQASASAGIFWGVCGINFCFRNARGCMSIRPILTSRYREKKQSL